MGVVGEVSETGRASDSPTVDPAELHDALLEAALHNTQRAAAAEADAPEDAALATKNYAQAALAQIQAAVTLVGRSRDGRRA